MFEGTVECERISVINTYIHMKSLAHTYIQ
jgi:hypothetical protein